MLTEKDNKTTILNYLTRGKVLFFTYLPTYPLRSLGALGQHKVSPLSSVLCSGLCFSPGEIPALQFIFDGLSPIFFFVFLLVFCLLVSILELSLVWMIFLFLRRAQAIGVVFVVSGLVCRWTLSISVCICDGLWPKYFADLFEADET